MEREREVPSISFKEIRKYQEEAKATQPVHMSATRMNFSELVDIGGKMMEQDGFKISNVNLDSYKGFKEGEADI